MWLAPTDQEVKDFLQIQPDDPHQDVLLKLVLDGTCQAIEGTFSGRWLPEN